MTPTNTDSQKLPAGTAVTVYGAPGVVLHVEWDGMIAVRLDGEHTWHCYSPCQVVRS